jgi:SMODS and SLOG-associating 2TM effector domain 2
MNESENTGAKINSSGNLNSARLPEFPSNSNGLTAWSLYRWVENAALEALDWYLTEKRSKARWSRTLRVVTVIFATAGSLAPLIAVGTGNTTYAFWGYPLLAISAGSIGLDRAFGFSSSWMRYLATAAALQRALLDFQLRWAALSGTRSACGTEPDTFRASALKEIHSFADQLSRIVENETQAWVAEFRGHFSRLEAEASHLQLP